MKTIALAPFKPMNVALLTAILALLLFLAMVVVYLAQIPLAGGGWYDLASIGWNG
jgi:hypothetical protein